MCGRVGSASSRRVGEWWGANVQKDDARVASKGGVAGGEADRDRRASEGTDAWRARGEGQMKGGEMGEMRQWIGGRTGGQ